MNRSASVSNSFIEMQIQISRENNYKYKKEIQIMAYHVVWEQSSLILREFIVSGSWDSSVRIWNRSPSEEIIFALVFIKNKLPVIYRCKKMLV